MKSKVGPCVAGISRAAAVLLVCLSLPRGPVEAQTPSVLTLKEAAEFLRIPAPELRQLAEQERVPGRRLGKRWRFSRTALLVWLAGSDAAGPVAVRNDDSHSAPHASRSPGRDDAPDAQTQAGGRKSTSLKAGELALTTGGGGDSPPDAPETAQEQTPATIGEKPQLRTAEEVFLRDQLLLEPSTLTLELGLLYSRNDQRDFVVAAPVPGAPTLSREQEIDSFTTILSTRYGLPSGYQLFASLPIRYQENTILFADRQVDSGSRTDLRALTAGVRRSVIREAAGRPEVILSAEGAIPTGDSSWSLGGSLALVKSVDPAVLFGNLGYRHTFSRDFDELALLEPEDTFTTTFGYALAVNDTLTLSTSFSGIFTGDSEFDRATLRSREQYSLQFGLTSFLTQGLYIEPTVSFNLNGTNPNVAVGVNLPYTFQP
jgi:excisionase family DNA binding protein